MKKIKLLILLFSCFVILGCGHTVYHKAEGTGVYGRIPLPNGGSLFEVAAGDINITSGALRGGAALSESSSKGGTFGAMSIARHSHISTAVALNEGNLEKVLTSSNVDHKTKQLIALYLLTRENIGTPPASVSAINSGASAGLKNDVPQVDVTRVSNEQFIETIKNIIDTSYHEKYQLQKNVDCQKNIWKSIMKQETIIIGSVIVLFVVCALLWFNKRKTNNITK